MAELTANIFREYFGGSWSGKITKNGEFQREVIFNWPAPFEMYSSLGIEAGLVVPPNAGALDDTRQVAIAGWRQDIRRWGNVWHNEFGGYGEMQWTSQEVVNGVTVLYGFIHECKQEVDDPTEHIIQCKILDHDNFNYSIRSFRKGLVEIVASRIRTAAELNELMENQTKTVLSFSSLGS